MLHLKKKYKYSDVNHLIPRGTLQNMVKWEGSRFYTMFSTAQKQDLIKKNNDYKQILSKMIISTDTHILVFNF